MGFWSGFFKEVRSQLVSQPKGKYRQIGQMEFRRILELTSPQIRASLDMHAKGLGTSRRSLDAVFKGVEDPRIRKELEKAAEIYYSKK
jgi:hypothetical protein